MPERAAVDDATLDGLELRPVVRPDDRGELVKVFDRQLFARAAPDLAIEEIFWTRSRRGVVRGLHFQVPPAAVAKLVFCAAGSVFDVVVDLRRGSATYGRWRHFILSAAAGNVVYVPIGFAHGFCALNDDSVVGYAQSGAFDPACDAGIRWDSLPIEWPIMHSEAIVSARDALHPAFDEFDSPFVAGS